MSGWCLGFIVGGKLTTSQARTPYQRSLWRYLRILLFDGDAAFDGEPLSTF